MIFAATSEMPLPAWMATPLIIFWLIIGSVLVGRFYEEFLSAPRPAKEDMEETK